MSRVKKVDVIRSTPRTTETVGDDGTVDSEYLSKPRKPQPLIKPSVFGYSSRYSGEWTRIFCKDEGMCPSDSEAD